MEVRRQRSPGSDIETNPPGDQQGGAGESGQTFTRSRWTSAPARRPSSPTSTKKVDMAKLEDDADEPRGCRSSPTRRRHC